MAFVISVPIPIPFPIPIPMPRFTNGLSKVLYKKCPANITNQLKSVMT